MISIIELTTVNLLEPHCLLLIRCVLTGLVIYVAVRILLQWLSPAETISFKWIGGAIVITGISLTSKLIHSHEPRFLSLRLGKVSINLSNHLHSAFLRCLSVFIFFGAIHIDDLVLFVKSSSPNNGAEAIRITVSSFQLCSEYLQKFTCPKGERFTDHAVTPNMPSINDHDSKSRHNFFNNLDKLFSVHLNARNLSICIQSSSDEVSVSAESCFWLKSMGQKMCLHLIMLKIDGNLREVGFQLDCPNLLIELASNMKISCRSKEQIEIELRDGDKKCRITADETHFDIAWKSAGWQISFKEILGDHDHPIMLANLEMPSSLRLNARKVFLRLQSSSDEVSFYAESYSWVKSISGNISIQTTKLQINGNLLGASFHLDCPNLPVELSSNMDIRCHSKDKIQMEIRYEDTNYRLSSEEADFKLAWKSPNFRYIHRDIFRSHHELSFDLKGFFFLLDPLNIGWYADQLSLKRHHNIIRVIMVSMEVNRCSSFNNFHVDCPNLKITFAKGSGSKLSICCDSRQQICVQLNMSADERRRNHINRSLYRLTDFCDGDVSFELTARSLSMKGDLFGTPVDLLVDQYKCTDLMKAKQLKGVVHGYNITMQNPRLGLDFPNEVVWNSCDSAHIDMNSFFKMITSIFMSKTIEQQLQLNEHRLNDEQLEVVYTIGVSCKKFCDIILAILETPN